MNTRDIYIYLVFSKTGTWLSRILNIATGTKYVHSSISLDDSFRRMYSFGRINPDNPFSAGLVEENLHDGVYKKFKKSECIIYKVNVTQDQYMFLLNEVAEFMRQKQDFKYNFLGLFGVLLNKPIKRKNKYFCSQFVSEILIKSHIYETDRLPELTRSNDLLELKNKELIYEGFISQYCACLEKEEERIV